MFNHLVTEDLVAIEDLNGNVVTGLNVLGELDLGKATLTDSFTKLVLPHTCPRRRCLSRAHLHLPPPSDQTNNSEVCCVLVFSFPNERLTQNLRIQMVSLTQALSQVTRLDFPLCFCFCLQKNTFTMKKINASITESSYHYS